MSSPIIEMDVHGLGADEAVREVEKKINSAGSSTYRIRVIHGFNGGTKIRDALRRELGYGLNGKILRIEGGSNQGVTEIVLREYF